MGKRGREVVRAGWQLAGAPQDVDALQCKRVRVFEPRAIGRPCARPPPSTPLPTPARAVGDAGSDRAGPPALQMSRPPDTQTHPSHGRPQRVLGAARVGDGNVDCCHWIRGAGFGLLETGRGFFFRRSSLVSNEERSEKTNLAKFAFSFSCLCAHSRASPHSHGLTQHTHSPARQAGAPSVGVGAAARTRKHRARDARIPFAHPSARLRPLVHETPAPGAA